MTSLRTLCLFDLHDLFVLPDTLGQLSGLEALTIDMIDYKLICELRSMHELLSLTILKIIPFGNDILIIGRLYNIWPPKLRYLNCFANDISNNKPINQDIVDFFTLQQEQYFLFAMVRDTPKSCAFSISQEQVRWIIHYNMQKDLYIMQKVIQYGNDYINTDSDESGDEE